MSLIKIENLSFAYPGSFDNVFDHASVLLDTDWKLGFVGRNGRGKTTLFRLLMGEYEYSGSIASSVAFEYFPYPVPDPSLLTLEVLSAVCPAAEEWELLRETSLLAVPAESLYRPFDTLSNGERAKALLAALFLNENQFLLIDEPTNHLDLAARETVARYLNRKKGFILVSHDRAFLDACVDHILSINKADIEVKQCDFTTWLADFERQQALEQEQNERLQKDIRRLRQAARRTADWSDKVERSKIGAGDKGHVGHMAAKMMQRSKNLQSRQQRAVEEKSRLLKNVEYDETLKIWPLPYHSEKLAEYQNRAVPGAGSYLEMLAPFLPVDLFSADGLDLSGMTRRRASEEIRYSGVLTGEAEREILRQLEYRYPYDRARALRSKYSVSELNAAAGHGGRKRKIQLDRPAFAGEEERISAARKGTAYHAVMEQLDFVRAAAEGLPYIEAKAAELLERGVLEEKELKAIDLGRVSEFFASPIGKRAALADQRGELEKERAFTLAMETEGEEVLVQGIIDCYFREDGKTVLIDYKSNYINEDKGEEEDRRLLGLYREQLRIYRDALEEAGLGPVTEVYLYLLMVNRILEVKE